MANEKVLIDSGAIVPQKTVQVFWRFSLFYTYLKNWKGIGYVCRLVRKPLITAF